MRSKSIWIIWSAWISTGFIIAWAILSLFVFKPQNVSLLHLLIWGFLMMLNVGFFLVGFIVATIEYYRSRHIVDLAVKKILFRRIFWAVPGLIMALLLVFLLGFLAFSVFQALVVVG